MRTGAKRRVAFPWILAALVVAGPAAAQTTLQPGESVSVDVGPAASPAFQVESDGNELVAVRVEQSGVDVRASVTGPGGGAVADVDGSVGPGVPEAVLFVADAPGAYRVTLTSADEEAGSGAARVTLVARRPWPDAGELRAQEVLNAWARAASMEHGPGAVAAVVRGGVPVASAAHGLANLELSVPMTTSTVLDVGSVSKQFTDFAIVLLALRGELDLDDDIRTHLPEVADVGHTIRIRNLVHHTSGIREVYGSLALGGWQAGDGISQGDAMALVSRMEELNFEPGSEYLYCNTAYMLLADIVSAVSGVPFPEFMEREVFGPLGMEQTSVMAAKGQIMWGAAESYGSHPEEKWQRIYDNSGLWGAGGVYSTVADLARWTHNFATGQVGGARAFEQMQERGVLTNGDTLDYAFGLTIGDHRGVRTVAHGGASAGYRASLLYFPDHDVGILTQANSPSTVPAGLEALLAEAMLGAHMEPAAVADDDADQGGDNGGDDGDGGSPFDGDLERLAGQYYSPELEATWWLAVEDGAVSARHASHGSIDVRHVGGNRFESDYPINEIEVVRDGDRVTGLRISNGRVRNMWFEKR